MTFTVNPGAKLGEAAIEPWVDCPRGIRSDGTAVNDLFAFKLRDPADAKRLYVNQHVALTGLVSSTPRELDDSTIHLRWWWRIVLPICVVLLVVSWWTIAIGRLQETSRHDLYGLLGHTDSGGQTF